MKVESFEGTLILSEWDELVERKHNCFKKNYPFCIYTFLKQLYVFFIPTDLFHYSVHKSIKIYNYEKVNNLRII